MFGDTLARCWVYVRGDSASNLEDYGEFREQNLIERQFPEILFSFIEII